MHIRRVIPALLAAVVSLAMAGCGDGDAPSGATAPRSTEPPAATAPDRPPATETRHRRPAPEPAPGRDDPPDRSREAEADFEEYCETHPGACAD